VRAELRVASILRWNPGRHGWELMSRLIQQRVVFLWELRSTAEVRGLGPGDIEKISVDISRIKSRGPVECPIWNEVEAATILLHVLRKGVNVRWREYRCYIFERQWRQANLAGATGRLANETSNIKTRNAPGSLIHHEIVGSLIATSNRQTLSTITAAQPAGLQLAAQSETICTCLAAVLKASTNSPRAWTVRIGTSHRLLQE